MDEQKLRVGITSSFVNDDAVNLVRGVVADIVDGKVPHMEIECIISTRARGDDLGTDRRLETINDFLRQVREETGIHIPSIEVSAKQAGRLKKNPTMEDKERYDTKVKEAIEEKCGRLPGFVLMLGDMITHGKIWCETIPSLNLHPDLPLAMGGIEGIYWNVIGEWIRKGRNEAGGMIHLATPELDAGTAVAYFRLPLRGVVNGVDLGPLWDGLPTDKNELEELIKKQTGLKDKPTDRLFQELRKAGAQFETTLIRCALGALANGKVVIREGKVLDETGKPIVELDLTNEVVGSLVIWPGGEGNFNHHRRTESL